MRTVTSRRDLTATRDGAGIGTTTRVVVTDPDVADEAAAILRLRVAELDRAASRFRPDSELSVANARAGRPVTLGPLLRDAVRVSVAMAAATGGLVDPTVGRAVLAAGYDRTFDLLPPAEGSAEVVAPAHVTAVHPVGRRPDWREIRLMPRPNGAELTVPLGVALDLGAVAKAWLADRISGEITAMWGCGALVDLGGDIALAGTAPEGGWVIGTPGGTAIRLGGGGIATSAQDRRRWQTANGPAHHLIDPRTGRPASTPWRSVTVCAATCAEANAATTAAMVLGEDAPGWLAAGGLAALLVPLEGVPVPVAGWPAGDRGDASMISPEVVWAVLRATGLVALVALTLSVASGLAGPAVRRPAPRTVLVTTHRTMAVVGLGLTGAHVVLAVLDSWVDVPVAAVVLPGSSGWEPFWVGVGAVAVDLLVVIALSSAMRRRGPRTWWTLHALTYPAWLLAGAHAFAVGTDSTSRAFLGVAVVGILLVLAAAIARWDAVRRGAPVGVPAPPTLPETGHANAGHATSGWETVHGGRR